jgi:hypothetical protein
MEWEAIQAKQGKAWRETQENIKGHHAFFAA